jgi:SAM-dependent methyltransferase
MSEPYTTDAAVMAAVKERYASAARRSLDVVDVGASCCGPDCCGGTSDSDPISGDLYDQDSVPSQGALTASLGCGNPTALIDLQPGQDVLDLGSGGGLDVLLSARRVAPGGMAFGVDMTDEMLELAQRNKAEAGVTNATFLKGTIENVPLPAASVDVVISNCVINLSSNKDAALAEAYRVLRPQGRFAVSDIVLLRPLPPELTSIVALWTGCIAGALPDTEYVSKLTAVGFADASVEVTRSYDRADIVSLAGQLDPGDIPAGLDIDQAIAALDGAFASAFIRATKAA